MALILSLYLWAGFSVWILVAEEDPSTRTPGYLVATLALWWLIPVIALFEPRS